jgi:hypothetical protein
MRARVLGFAAGVALALAASAPAKAQFMYPVMAIEPAAVATAQSIVMPKLLKSASPKPNAPVEAQLPPPAESQCHLSGRLRLCQ